MHRLNELASKLTPEQLHVVEDFAEFLIARNGHVATKIAEKTTWGPISYEGWAGCLADVHPEMSDREFNKLIMDDWANAAED